ncbi:MAG: hypothetical protein KDC98_16010 [Planctomycetes bacterium]|nr:hypothetical protein [Planctomycetota bacterium]
MIPSTETHHLVDAPLRCVAVGADSALVDMFRGLRRGVLALLLLAAPLLLGSCMASRSTAAPPRQTPSLASLERLARGERIALPDAQLLIPTDYVVPADGAVPLAIHFQGGVVIAEENFARMHRPGVLIASTLAGRSSAFSVPYRDPAAFRTLLAAGERVLAERAGREVRFGPILITFFSAGYGAVRELLKEPEFFDRITALVSADSIYASVVAPDVRAPEAEQMVDFLRFAQAAARGEKTFVLAHGRYRTDYASTAECADLVLASVGGVRQPGHGFTDRGVPIGAEFHCRGFHLYAFDEATAGIHVDCLWMIPELVRRHVGAGS